MTEKTTEKTCAACGGTGMQKPPRTTAAGELEDPVTCTSCHGAGAIRGARAPQR